jgi:CRISPR system Cascade subunit CasC
MNNRLYLDIHVLQTVPPSCINRDDTGSPKTAIYGGVTRARVSSQAWKKAVRDYFKENAFENGIRTKYIFDLIAKEFIAKEGENQEVSQADAETAIKEILDKTGVKISKDKDNNRDVTGALFFISLKQVKELAKLAKEGKFEKNIAQDAIKKNPAVDMALFGRMVAEDGGLNIEASCQVAHAISTHKITNEYDYFTAVDEKETDHSGAGMIGTVEYNSSTLYRYATVAVHELNKQLGETPEKTAEAVEAFIKAFVLSMPTGKKNTFANQTPPYAVYVVLRNDQPANFAGAFETAIKIGKDDSGYAEKSAKALADYTNETKNWLAEPVKDYSTGNIEIGEKVSFNTLTRNIKNDICEKLCS